MNPDTQPNPLPNEEVARLGEALRDCCCRQQRTEQHECWAWTRLQATLRDSPSNRAGFWTWALAGAATAALALAVLVPGDGTDQSPVAQSQSTRIWAGGYHMHEARADVIWATGYDYIPASYPVK